MKLFYYTPILGTFALALQANAQENIWGLDDSNNIIAVDSSNPSAGVPIPVSGLVAGDELVGLDFRAGNGQMYAIGLQNNVYTLDRTTFGATLVGNFADGVNDDPANVGPLSGNTFAFDFNPAFTPDASANVPGSFARIISDTSLNRVINSNTGEYLGAEKTDVFYAAGDINEGAAPNIQGIGYDTNILGSTGTTQFGIDTATDYLVTVANNAGTLNSVAALGTDFSGDVGFDVSATGIAYAAFDTGATGSQLYTVDLTDGSQTLIGDFGTGNNIRSISTLGAVPEPSTTALLFAGVIGLARRRRRS